MTIHEAIFFIATRAKDLEFRGYDREARALRLGIEALKLIRSDRLIVHSNHFPPLPGETED